MEYPDGVEWHSMQKKYDKDKIVDVLRLETQSQAGMEQEAVLEHSQSEEPRSSLVCSS